MKDEFQNIIQGLIGTVTMIVPFAGYFLSVKRKVESFENQLLNIESRNNQTNNHIEEDMVRLEKRIESIDSKLDHILMNQQNNKDNNG